MMQSGSPFQCAALHGLSSIIEWLFPSVVTSVDITDALYAAAKHGHLAVVKALVLVNDTVNSDDNHALVGKGRKYPLGLLLGKVSARKEPMQKNANTGISYGKALYAASDAGHKEIVQILVEKGANVNAREGRYGNALQVASSQGHKEAVQMLLERGANVNARGRGYGNALQVASSQGHKEVVQLLLEGGGDVNMQGRDYGNALQAASFQGHIAAVKSLLRSGAQVSCSHAIQIQIWDHGEHTLTFCNALHAASLGGHGAVVELLLNHDVITQHIDAALDAALGHGFNHIAQLILNHGPKLKNILQ